MYLETIIRLALENIIYFPRKNNRKMCIRVFFFQKFKNEIGFFTQYLTGKQRKS